MYQGTEIIAEVKTRSPFGYQSSHSWEELFDVAQQVGDIIAVHTDPRWEGSFELLKKACKQTNRPILAKGIHKSDDDIKRAIECGAEWVLVVGRLPKVFSRQCMIEPFNLADIQTIPEEFRVVWNARDLTTGNRKKESFAQVRALWKGWLCQASFIKTIKDIEEGADAILVGTHLLSFAKSLRTKNMK